MKLIKTIVFYLSLTLMIVSCDSSTNIATTQTVLSQVQIDNLEASRTQAPNIINICPALKEDQSSLTPEGALVVINQSGSFLFYLSENVLLKLNKPEENIFRFISSPDLRSFTAFVVITNQLGVYSKRVISSFDGVLEDMAYPYDSDPLWLDSQRVYTLRGDINSPPEDLVVIDSISTEKTILNLGYLDQSVDLSEYKWEICPDRTLTYTVIPTNKYQEGSTYNIISQQYSLYTIKSGQIIASIPSTDSFSREKYPVWSVDSTRFYVASSAEKDIHHDDIYSMDIKGKLTRLTYLSESNNYVDISRISISPNSEYLAFWLRLDEEKPLEEYLAVLMINNGSIHNYCLRGNINSTGTTCYNGYSPIWSADSKYIAITSCESQNDELGIHTDIILLDINNNIYKKILQDYYLAGWIVTNK
jgi:hypothetical protein